MGPRLPHCPIAKVTPLGTKGETTVEPRRHQLQASVYLADEKEKINKLTETLGQLGALPTSRSDSRLRELGWKGVFEMKDRILNQKNQLNERLVQNIARLQQELMDSKTRLKEVVALKGQEANQSILSSRVQELESLHDRLKLDIMETTNTKDAEIERLSKNLDSAEHDVKQVLARITELDRDTSKRISSLMEQISEKTSMIEILEQRIGGVNIELAEYNQRAVQFDTSVPAIEELKWLKSKVMELQLEVQAQARERAKEHHTLQMSGEVLLEKEMLLQSSQEDIVMLHKELSKLRMCSEFQNKRIAFLKPENSQLRKECENLQKVVIEAETKCQNKLLAMRERHNMKYFKVTAGLWSQVNTKNKKAKALKQKLAKSLDAMTALKSELQSSQETIGKLTSSMKELESQNQDLLEEKRSLQEESEEADKRLAGVSKAQSQMAVELVTNIIQSVDDLESLVKLAIEVSKGNKPNSSVLLEPEQLLARYVPMEIEVFLERSNLKDRLEQVNRLSAEIERLKTAIHDIQAVNLSNAACNVQ